jgi:glycosyltransferase involved in cell wall biosynthesis
MSKANVLHVIDTLSVGGAEKLLVGTINGLPQFNHHVITLCGKHALAKDLPEDCAITDLGFKGKIDSFRCAMQIRRYVRKHNISVVHSHLVMATIIARLGCPRNVQLFSTIHSVLGSRCFAAGKRIQKFIEKLTYRRRHHIVAVSGEVCRDYDACIGIKGDYTILPNFVEDKFFKKDYKKMSFNGTFRMVTVGSLKPAKNHAYLIEAFKSLPKGVHLDVYGDGPMRDELQAQINEHKLNIRLIGSCDNVQEVLPNYDLFVMSSKFEGQPVALLEAMAGGMPAALSDIPVLREATGNEGIFFDLADKNDFISKVTAIANHEVDLDVFAKANFERVQYTARKDKYMNALENMYMSAQPARRAVRQPSLDPVYNLLPGMQRQPELG